MESLNNINDAAKTIIEQSVAPSQNDEIDTDKHFCKSLVAPLKALSPKKNRLPQVKILKGPIWNWVRTKYRLNTYIDFQYYKVGLSRTSVTSEVDFFVIITNDFKLLAIVWLLERTPS